MCFELPIQLLLSRYNTAELPNLVHQSPGSRKISSFSFVVEWCSQFDNQLVTLVLDSLDDMESSIRELALSAVLEMLKNQVCMLVLENFHCLGSCWDKG
jgi:hypothetical protein